jgi:hypothetical protein
LSQQEAQPVGPVEGKQSEGFIPGGGLAALLQGQDVFPIEELASHHDRLAAIESVSHQANGQFGELLLKSLAQASKAPEFAVFLLGLRVVHVHLLVHEGKECALGANDGELENIAIASAIGGRLATLVKTLAAFFLNTAIHDHKVPAVKQAGVVKGPSLQQITKHERRDLRHQLRIHATGVVGCVVRTADRRAPRKARIFRALVAQLAHVPSGFTRLALLVIAIARTGAGQERANDLPPEVGGGINAHFLHTGVGQAIEPGIKFGKGCPPHPDKALSAQRRINARKRLAARWLAAWLRIRAREWRVT